MGAMAQGDSTVQEQNAAPAAKQAQRVIKKYPNRRLYDTTTSSYITLAEVKHLVMASEHLVVRDAKTSEDITRSILLQIILEEEAGGAPMFTESVLSNIIRFYGQSKLTEQSQGMTPEMWTQFMSAQSPMVQGLMGSYADQSRTMFTQMQEQVQKQTEQMLGALGLKR